MFRIISFVIIHCFAGLGFLFIIFLSIGSTHNAKAGKPSLTKFIHRICMAINGNGNPIKLIINITNISHMFVESRKLTNFLILSKIHLHSFTAFTIVAKLSSVKIISDASLETSVQVIHIATHISESFSAGASFTQSQVIATICHCFCRIFTILCLCSGFTLAKIETVFIFIDSSSSEKFSISNPEIDSPLIHR